MTGDPDNEYHQGDRIKKFLAADIFGAFRGKTITRRKIRKNKRN